jgi:hypothetical protein
MCIKMGKVEVKKKVIYYLNRENEGSDDIAKIKSFNVWIGAYPPIRQTDFLAKFWLILPVIYACLKG